MSRSPKYSTVRSSERRRKRLAAERVERERKRRAEQVERAAVAFTNASTAADTRLTALAERCTETVGDPAATDEDREQLATAVARARRALTAADTLDELAALTRRLEDVERQRVAVVAELLRRGRHNAAQQLASLRAMLGELDPADRTRFDRSAAASLDQAMTKLAGVLDRGDVAAFDERIEDVRARLREHHVEVTTSAARHAEQHRAARRLIDENAARIAGLVGDAAAADIPFEDLAVAGEVLDEVRTHTAADRPADAVELGNQLLGRLDDVERDLDSAIERLSARREMLGSIVDALPELGFAVDAGSLTHGLDGSVGIQARRIGGEGLMVVVQNDAEEEHRVNYLRETASGQPLLDARACSSLVSLAESLNSSIRRAGFDAGEVSWEGTDPDHRPPRRRTTNAEQATRYRSAES